MDSKTCPSLRRTGMSANSGDELNLRHLHCSRDNLSLHDRRDVQPSNCSTCTTGTSTTLSTRCTTGMSTTLSKNWTTQRRRQLRNLHSFLHCLNSLHLQPDDDELQLRNLHSFQHHVHRLVDDLLSKTLERHVGSLVQELHNAACRRPNPRTIGNPLWASRAPPQTEVTITVVSLRTRLWGPRVRGSLSRRRRHQTDKSCGQQLPRESRPSSDSSRCTCRPVASS